MLVLSRKQVIFAPQDSIGKMEEEVQLCRVGEKGKIVSGKVPWSSRKSAGLPHLQEKILTGLKCHSLCRGFRFLICIFLPSPNFLS